MLAEITRHSRFTAEEFRVLATERPIDVPDLHREIRNMIEGAEEFIGWVPGDEVGYVFMDGTNPVQPEAGGFAKYARRGGSRAGIWPGSSEIGSAMLERLWR